MIDLSPNALLAEARNSLRDPRGAARRIIALDPPMQARWIGLALMAVGSAILTHFSLVLIPEADRDAMMQFMVSPVRTALLQAALLLMIVQMVYWMGRARGGVGNFPDALLVMVWLQFLMLVVQTIQLVVMVLLPPLAALVNIASFAIFVWLFTNFVAELHGFRSLLAVFGGIVFGAILLAFGLAILLLLLTGGAPA